MADTFKFRFVMDGNPKGLFASKGHCTDQGLQLGEDFVPYETVVDSTNRDDRLILVVDTRSSELSPNLRANFNGNALVLAVSGNKSEAIERAVDKFASKIAADKKKAALTELGEGHTFRCVTCPACESTVDLTGYEKTPYTYCRFCESLFGDGLENLKGAAQYRTCDECGYHDRVQGYGAFYFYFLLVVYGFRHSRTHLCDACGKSLSNKLLLANSIFLLGVPNAIACAVRSRAGKDSRMKGLSQANHFVKKKKLDKAEEEYKKSLKIFKNHPGVHYNRALGHLTNGDTSTGLEALKLSLEACPNYIPAQRLQLRILEAAGRSPE